MRGRRWNGNRRKVGVVTCRCGGGVGGGEGGVVSKGGVEGVKPAPRVFIERAAVDAYSSSYSTAIVEPRAIVSSASGRARRIDNSIDPIVTFAASRHTIARTGSTHWNGIGTIGAWQ